MENRLAFGGESCFPAGSRQVTAAPKFTIVRAVLKICAYASTKDLFLRRIRKEYKPSLTTSEIRKLNVCYQ
jgi:hypothetical protein